MMNATDAIQKYLGRKVRDRVTRFEGVATHVGFDLYGCVQAIVHQEHVETKDGEKKLGESYRFDVKRLMILDDEPVMPLPNFATVPGGDDRKPTK